MTKRLLLLGGPGSGKGTQAGPLCAQYNICHISTGDIFRAAVKEGSPLGHEAKTYMDRGELVPDDIVVGIVRDRLACEDCSGGFVLDGFPRSVAQAEALGVALCEMNAMIDGAILIDVAPEMLIKRLTSRRVCKQCGAGYNVLFKPPSTEGVCDACGGEVYQREDDQEATIRNRLTVYERETAPVLEFYRRAGLLREVDGDRLIADITSAIVEVVGA